MCKNAEILVIMLLLLVLLFWKYMLLLALLNIAVYSLPCVLLHAYIK